MIFKGISKFVIKLNKVVIKFPNIFNGLDMFYYGLYLNKRERLWKRCSKSNDTYIPNIYHINFFGLFTIQEYCRPLTRKEYSNLLKFRIKDSFNFENFSNIDLKKENFGYSSIKDKIVLIDWI